MIYTDDQVVCNSKPTQCLPVSRRLWALTTLKAGGSAFTLESAACACLDKLCFVNDRCRKSKILDDECLNCKPYTYRSPCWQSASEGDHFVLRILNLRNKKYT